MSVYVESSRYFESARGRGVSLARVPETRVVITGMEAITPLGYLSDTITAFKEGRSGVIYKDVGNYHTGLQAPLPEWYDPESLLVGEERKMIGRLGAIDTDIARRAGHQAGILDKDGHLDQVIAQTHRNRAGSWIGSGISETQYLIDAYLHLNRAIKGVVDPKSNSRRMSAALAVRVFPEEHNGDVARLLRLSGESGNTAEACATGASNIYQAYKSILTGENDISFGGGSDDALFHHADVTLGLFASGLGALSKRNDNPQAASRPFDKTRDGFITASGCGGFVFEGLSHALRRGAPIFAEVLGAKKLIDGKNKTELNPETVADTIAGALYDPVTQGLIRPDAIFAHATSTPVGDILEAQALSMVFGKDLRFIPVTAIKSFIGHTLGAAGAINVAIAVNALQEQELSYILNCQDPDLEIMRVAPLELVRDKFLKHSMRTVLAVAYGFGGYNCALLLGKYVP